MRYTYSSRSHTILLISTIDNISWISLDEGIIIWLKHTAHGLIHFQFGSIYYWIWIYSLGINSLMVSIIGLDLSRYSSDILEKVTEFQLLISLPISQH